jgi:serine protease Do
MSNDAPRTPWDRPRRDRGRAFFGSATALALVLAGALGAKLIDSTPANAATGPVAAGQAIAPLAPLNQPASFADLVERVAPAVVSVKVEGKIEMTAADSEQMKRFFEQFGVPVPEGAPEQGEERKSEAMGSGFIIDAGGYIVTNNHVIDGADKITVILNDGREIDAKLIGTDPGTDIALLKVESKDPLPYVLLGDDSKLRPGDWVVAVGNPFGLGGTVTAGIVSARGRNIGSGPYTDYLQIDAPINRGNSGGPAFNTAGEVIGVNSAIYTPSGGSVGIGFAVPAATVTKVVAQLRDHGSVTRGWLGVQIQAVDAETAQAVGLPEPKGALVSMVTEGSPAAAAGFKTGDVVLKANGTDLKDNRALARFVAELTVGQTATFDVWRDSANVTLTATIAARDEDKIRAAGAQPDPQAPAATESLPGVKVAAITDEIRRTMEFAADTQGIVVTEVTKGSDAETKGLTKGDLIVAIGNVDVKTMDEVSAAVKAAKDAGRKSVLVLVEEQGVRRYLALSVG